LTSSTSDEEEMKPSDSGVSGTIQAMFADSAVLQRVVFSIYSSVCTGSTFDPMLAVFRDENVSCYR